MLTRVGLSSIRLCLRTGLNILGLSLQEPRRAFSLWVLSNPKSLINDCLMNDEKNLSGSGVAAFGISGQSSSKVNYLCCVCRCFMHTAVVVVPLFSLFSWTLALFLNLFVVLNCSETQGRPRYVFSVNYVDSIKCSTLFFFTIVSYFLQSIQYRQEL